VALQFVELGVLVGSGVRGNDLRELLLGVAEHDDSFGQSCYPFARKFNRKV
jgi:hypothetical protein